MFFTFGQNNSGGHFHFNEKRGITHWIIVEGANRDDAIARAEVIGVYFDGVANGSDCECCGDRWNDYGDETDKPMIYNQPVEAYTSTFGGWMEDGKEICVHYKDGTMKWYGVNPVKQK